MRRLFCALGAFVACALIVCAAMVVAFCGIMLLMWLDSISPVLMWFVIGMPIGVFMIGPFLAIYERCQQHAEEET